MRKTRTKRLAKGGNKTPRIKEPHKGKDACNILDTQLTKYASNSIWQTCIRQNGEQNNIYYIIPKNAIMKDIKTVRSPLFSLKHNGKSDEFIVQINGQLVSCFLYIKQQWYALAMINFSVVENFHYYKLDGVNSLYDKNGNIVLRNAKLISQPPNPTDSNPKDIISITKTTEVSKTSNKFIYGLLNKFVLQKLTGSTARELPIDAVGFYGLDEGLDALKGIF